MLLFGGKKLPELARGSGKALRIFKTEVKGLHDDDDDDTKPEAIDRCRGGQEARTGLTLGASARQAGSRGRHHAARRTSSRTSHPPRQGRAGDRRRHDRRPGSSIRPIFDFLKQPYVDGIQPLLKARASSRDIVLTGIGGGVHFQLKISLVVGHLDLQPVLAVAGLGASCCRRCTATRRSGPCCSPAPGLRCSSPASAFAYLLLPKAHPRPDRASSPIGLGSLLTGARLLQLHHPHVLVFGVACEIPLVVVLLNRIGLVNARQLAARPAVDRSSGSSSSPRSPRRAPIR